MRAQRKPTGKIWAGLLFFLLWAVAMIAGLTAGVPSGLQATGVFLFLSYLVGTSIYLVWKAKSSGRKSWGDEALLPPRLRRWILDVVDSESKP